MRRIILITASLLISIGVYALEPCPDNQPKEKWDNCTGTATYSNGLKYVGEFKDGKWHGQGTLAFDGNKYVGEFKDNKIHGYGTWTRVNGDKYVGEWKDSKKHGQGTYTWADGDIYKGLWKEDHQSVGFLTFPSGNSFNLSYYNPLTKEAIGDFYYADGNIIKDAHFINSLLNGEGTFICAETSKCAGQQIKGNWKDGEFVGSSSPVANFLKDVIVGTITGLPKAYLTNKVVRKVEGDAYKKGYEQGRKNNRKRGPQPLPKNEPCGASCPD